MALAVRNPDPLPRPLLSLEQIDKHFAGTHAVRGVSLTFLPADVHAIVGENGAGKSTLMRILAGLHPDYGGRIQMDGTPVEIRSPRKARELGIAMVHQELALVPELSVAENMFLGRQPRRFVSWWIDKRQTHTRAAEILDSIEADIRPTDKVGRLPIAKQQLVEIAKGISMQSRLLILDEPTASLTEPEIRDLFRVIRTARASGVSIIYISHKLREVFEISDRITAMRDGTRQGTRPTADWSETELVAQMVGRRLGELPARKSASRPTAVLELRGFSRPPYFSGIDLIVHRGEVVGIYGLVGSGRSRLAKAIFGLLPARGGEIRINGKPIEIATPRDAIAKGIALVPEDRRALGLIPVLDVAVNLTIASLRAAFGMFIRRDADRQVVANTVAALKIRAASTRMPVSRLSGGNQQKVVLGKWLATGPSLLILDEPTRGIDVGAKAEIRAKIDELATEGMGIVLISSDLPEVTSMSDRILVMREGRVAAAFDRRHFDEEAIGACAIRGTS